MSKHRRPACVAACAAALKFAAASLLIAGAATAAEKDPAAVIELGGAGDWDLPSGAASFGPTAAIEFTPVKDWLEIEAGVTSLFGHRQTEWDTDFVFKKPFDLSPNVEFEPGIGPAWIHTIGAGKTTDALAAEVVFDFMIWPTSDRKFGWFVEPSYGYAFDRNHEQSLGVSAGLLIAIP